MSYLVLATWSRSKLLILSSFYAVSSIMTEMEMTFTIRALLRIVTKDLIKNTLLLLGDIIHLIWFGNLPRVVVIACEQ